MLVNQSKFRNCVRRAKAGDNLREISESCKHSLVFYFERASSLWREGVSTSVSFISTMGEDHSLPSLSFVNVWSSCFHSSRPVGVFLFAVQRAKERLVKCHRPWTVWTRGEGGKGGTTFDPGAQAIFTYSPSSESVSSSRVAWKAICKAFIFTQRENTQHQITFLKPFSNPWWFYMIFIMWKESFCNEIAQDVYTVVLKKRRRRKDLCIVLKWMSVSLCPRLFTVIRFRLSRLQMFEKCRKEKKCHGCISDHSCVYQKVVEFLHSLVNNFSVKTYFHKKRKW